MHKTDIDLLEQAKIQHEKVFQLTHKRIRHEQSYRLRQGLVLKVTRLSEGSMSIFKTPAFQRNWSTLCISGFRK